MNEESIPQKLGRYEIVRILGKGAMGVVYEGRDPNIGRRVAIKTARADVVESTGMGDELMARFLREARAAGALNHPNIITIYDASEEEGTAYIAMEFIEGGSLEDAIDARRRPGVEETVKLGAQICQALDHAHQHGIVHRDIKPANIMLPERGKVKVADFGIARMGDSKLTQTGAVIGTPQYMSPEQFMAQTIDGRSDLFAVGAILYELLTGEKAFPGAAISTVMHAVLKVNPISPSELNVLVPETLSQVVMKALSKRPAERFSSGEAMANALLECLKADPNPAVLSGDTGGGSATLVRSDAKGTVVTTPVDDAGATVVNANRAGESTVVRESMGGATVNAATAKPLRRGLLIGGIVAVVLLLSGGVAWMFGGSAKPSAEPAAKPSRFAFTIYEAKTNEVYHKYGYIPTMEEFKQTVPEKERPAQFISPSGSGELRDPKTGKSVLSFNLQQGATSEGLDGAYQELELYFDGDDLGTISPDKFGNFDCFLIRSPRQLAEDVVK